MCQYNIKLALSKPRQLLENDGANFFNSFRMNLKLNHQTLKNWIGTSQRFETNQEKINPQKNFLI
jgi:hypothetical protein